MRYGFFTTFAPDCTFPEACALAKSVGYQGIQPRIVVSNCYDPSKPLNPWGNNKHGILEQDFFADPKGVLKPVYDNGLEVTSVASYANLEDLKRAKKLIKACGEAGIGNMRIAPAPPRQGALRIRRQRDHHARRTRSIKKVLPTSKRRRRQALPGAPSRRHLRERFGGDAVRREVRPQGRRRPLRSGQSRRRRLRSPANGHLHPRPLPRRDPHEERQVDGDRQGAQRRGPLDLRSRAGSRKAPIPWPTSSRCCARSTTRAGSSKRGTRKASPRATGS